LSVAFLVPDISAGYYHNVHSVRVKCPFLLSDFNESLIFSTDFRKILKLSDFMKILLVRAEVFHADRQTDMAKLIVTFCKFTNAPEKVKL
jgi:hypothetical protein